jgi:MFS family permease
MGWWTLMTTCGAPGGPFIMGFVVQHLGWRWIFWLLAIVNFGQCLAYIVLGHETLWSPDQQKPTTFVRSLIPRRINPAPCTFGEFVGFLSLTKLPAVVIPSCAYAIVFCYAGIAILIEMPTAIGRLFGLDAQQTGLQFLAMLIGSILGEQFSGPCSDYFQRRRDRRLHSSHKGSVKPTHRLWFSYLGFATSMVGLIVWGVTIEQSTAGKWNIRPLIGGAIAAFGNQVVATTLITYAVDCHKSRSQEIGIYVNLTRQVYGFVGPFYFTHMFDSLKFSGAGGLMAGLIGVFAFLPVAVLHLQASRNKTTE